MSSTICEQVQSEIVKYDKEFADSQKHKDYVKFLEMYNDLIAKGLTKKRESLMRSISDPPATPDNTPLYGQFLQ